MNKKIKAAAIALSVMVLIAGCSKKIKQQDDEIYSRHLQSHVKLVVISTPVPNDKTAMNLLLVNDGADFDQLNVKGALDSLYRKKLIKPLIIVGIKADDRVKEYGVSNLPDYQGNGSRADKYAAFVINELLPFIRKRAGIRKFSSVVLSGSSLGGLSAFDIAWDNADKIDKVGVFSGAFWWRDKDQAAADYNDQTDRIMLRKVSLSRKKPGLQYWFYAGQREETADRDKDGIIDVIDDTKDLIDVIKSKNLAAPAAIVYREDPMGTHDYASWRRQFPAFLLWAFGK